MDVLIGISDHGAFGDIVSGVKVGQALAQGGHSVTYATATRTEHGTPFKFDTLFPDLKVYIEDWHSIREADYENALRISVISSSDFPWRSDVHINEFDWSTISDRLALTLSPGIGSLVSRVEYDTESMIPFGSQTHVPMFYSPYQRDTLPDPGEEDIREVIMGNAGYKVGNSIRRVLEGCERIGVCYSWPAANALTFIDQVRMASKGSSERLGLVVLADGGVESAIKTRMAEHGGYTVVDSAGKVHAGKNSDAVVIILGNRSQTVTTRLFWASEMPNLVTGDHSLSDAIYGLVFGNGQGFFYETKNWKSGVSGGIMQVMKDYEPKAAWHFIRSLGDFTSSSAFTFGKRDGYPSSDNPIASVLSSSGSRDSYTETQRNAFRQAVRHGQPDFNLQSVIVQEAVRKIVGMFEADPTLLKAFRDESGSRRTAKKLVAA